MILFADEFATYEKHKRKMAANVSKQQAHEDANAPLWVVTKKLSVRANTKSEARARLKKLMGQARLPVGIILVKNGR